MNNLIVYGDIHGCYNSFVSLRTKIAPQEGDVEVCVGDVITKGDDSLRVLDYLIKYRIISVLGNHEDKIIRYIKHSKINKKNPIVLDQDEQNIVKNLQVKHREYLENMPLYYKHNDIVVLHGGLLNNFRLENLLKKEKQQILRMRYLDRNGYFVAYGKETMESTFWADSYDGREGFVVYGHQWFKEIKKSKFALGIDTGCVYGNKLSAVQFDHNKNYKIFEQKCSH